MSFRKVNVFWPQKQVAAICGPLSSVDIEAPPNGTLIIKTYARKDTKALLKTTTFCGKSVKVSPHQSRNTTKGTIFAPELRHMSEEDILADLRGDGVQHLSSVTQIDLLLNGPKGKSSTIQKTALAIQNFIFKTNRFH